MVFWVFLVGSSCGLSCIVVCCLRRLCLDAQSQSPYSGGEIQSNGFLFVPELDFQPVLSLFYKKKRLHYEACYSCFLNPSPECFLSLKGHFISLRKEDTNFKKASVDLIGNAFSMLSRLDFSQCHAVARDSIHLPHRTVMLAIAYTLDLSLQRKALIFVPGHSPQRQIILASLSLCLSPLSLSHSPYFTEFQLV